MEATFNLGFSLNEDRERSLFGAPGLRKILAQVTFTLSTQGAHFNLLTFGAFHLFN